MKKLITLIIAVFMITFANAQTFERVTKALYYTYENDKWIAGEPIYPNNMFIIMKGNYITITNAADSKYKTYGDSKKEKTKEYESSTWDAYDEQGKACKFTMTKYVDVEGYSVFITYDLVAIQFIAKFED